MTAPVFTVFTPTYNRAHTLNRVHKSLIAQTFSDFEWLIVDDGSTDGTDALVNDYMLENRIAIRYIRQPNGGKHIAFNRGVREARGEFFLPLDSDDSCTPNALDRFQRHWHSIPETQRTNFSGITCLCKDERGEIVGKALPAESLDGHPYWIISRHCLTGEKWGFHRTSILRLFPFPETPGEKFVPEGLIWNRIGKKYKIRFVNEALRHYYDTPDGLAASSIENRLQSPKATFMYYSELMALPIRFYDRLRAASNMWRFLFHSKQWWAPFNARAKSILWFVGIIPGFSLYLVDIMRNK